jgi:hypothetical protein
MRVLDWLRVILTSRSYGEEVSRELDDFNPRIVHLYGEQHMNDIQVKKIYNNNNNNNNNKLFEEFYTIYDIL